MSFRKDRLTKPIFRWAKGAMPAISATEREAIEAGTVWWDGELFSGSPDWDKLLAMPAARLSPDEQRFMDGPVAELCSMIDEWQMAWKDHDLPKPVWDFMRSNKFFGMVIPKRYGGLGFSNLAHSEVVRTISSASVTAGVTVMVPNSLGPGELLLHFGTEEQRQHWLPRLADGREIPCFGLTSADAGSDAAAMQDRGVVEMGEHEGRQVLGIRLNFSKRYITLGPVATVMGLAFKLFDPEQRLGRGTDLGITVALIPTTVPGVKTGDRHIPQFTFFQNGPLEGRDVFIPMDWVLGGEAQIGQGWTMLMRALAAGRGISLPSQSAAACAYTARVSGAYARVRTQFNTPIGMFEGIQEKLADLAANAYLVDAARRLTCAALDEGHRPSVVSAIMKSQATERMRQSTERAMDIHGGKAIIDGPRNYLGGQYRSVPIGITVEGANILTRSLMIFGQGAIRAHPFMLKEMEAIADPDETRGLEAFDKHFWSHALHAAKNAATATIHGWTGGLAAHHPKGAAFTSHWRQLSRYASAFSMISDLSLLTLGGSLKRREMISARLGDILSELYLLGASLKRFETEGRPEADRPIVEYVMQKGYNRLGVAFAGVLDNLPARWAAMATRVAAFPFGIPMPLPADELTTEVAEILMRPSSQRDRLTPDLYLGQGREGHPVRDLEGAFALVTEVAPLEKRLREAKSASPEAARDAGLIDEAELAKLSAAREAVRRVIEVDAFPMADVSPIAGQHDREPDQGARRAEAAE
ncbi:MULTISPECIES: acyl-CoA dehydrogenase [unclassified Aureimonas]|uniref:acyl-CoA dehydrogenase n=1 Tax=unclassified Aureimonas TaxID=2615206 RepID=UPI0006F64122|nr:MULTISPECIES: acyl-CoA dehydrogenase [unclassified Aureimonas]KQT65121.1 acyl-CoA dehydrogenase [Aureimonas sp. Leaf427]KQT76229.1 acyl-CoA dehydrogenase [Aureimonas sp. Leaf460]